MYEAVMEHFEECHLVVKAAAVADYRPAAAAEQKMKKENFGECAETAAEPRYPAGAGPPQGWSVSCGLRHGDGAPG